MWTLLRSPQIKPAENAVSHVQGFQPEKDTGNFLFRKLLDVVWVLSDENEKNENEKKTILRF